MLLILQNTSYVASFGEGHWERRGAEHFSQQQSHIPLSNIFGNLIEAFYPRKQPDICPGLVEFTAEAISKKVSGFSGFSSVESWSIYFISIFSNV